MNADEIRDLTTDEILEELDDAREELMKLRFQTATGELTDFNRLKISRNHIARLLTVLNQRSREEAPQGEEDQEGEA